MRGMKGRLGGLVRDPASQLGFLHVLNDGWFASLPLLLPFIQGELGIDFAQVGLLSSLLSLAGVALALPAASIARKAGGLRTLVAGALLYSLAFVAVGLSAGFPSLVLAFGLASVGFGLFHPVGFAMVAHGSGPEELGRRMGGFTAVGDIGRVGVAACVTLLVALAGWRRTALAYGCVPAVLALGLYAASRGSPARSGPEESGGKARGLRRNRRFLLATASGFIDALASSSLFVFIPFLYIHRGASTALLGSLSGAFFVGNMLGKVVLGRIADRLGSRKVFVLSELLMAGLLVALGAAKSLPALVVVSVLLGAVTKGTVPVLNTIIAASVPDRRLFDKAFGAGAFANGVAAAAAPLLFGWVIDERGIVAVFGVCAAFAVAAVLPVALEALLERRAAA